MGYSKEMELVIQNDVVFSPQEILKNERTTDNSKE